MDARLHATNPTNERILNACDELRNRLPSLGVEFIDARVCDGADGNDDWRYCVPRTTLSSNEPNDLAFSGKKGAKTDNTTTPYNKGSVSPQNLFRLDPRYEGVFSVFDDNGIPTRNADGSMVSKTKQKKFSRKQAKHAKLVEEK